MTGHQKHLYALPDLRFKVTDLGQRVKRKSGQKKDASLMGRKLTSGRTVVMPNHQW